MSREVSVRRQTTRMGVLVLLASSVAAASAGASGQDGGSRAENGSIVFNAASNGELYTISPRGGRPKRLTYNDFSTTSFSRDSEPAYSPGGEMIAFTEERVESGTLVGWGIDVMRADGTHIRRLTPPGNDFSPAWSPDGRRIAFIRRTPSAALYVVSLKTGKAKLIRPLAGGADAWAPKHWITIDSVPLGGGLYDGIRLVSVNGHSSRLVTNPPAASYDEDPDWAPDGRRFAFVRYEPGPCAKCATATLCVAHVGIRRVRSIATDLAAPSWSPDGRWIAAVDRYTGELVVIRPDGSHRHVLTRAVVSAQIDWRPRRSAAPGP